MSAFNLLVGDALERLREMPDESVQTCVTSPPYWGLRDYGVEGQIGLEPTMGEFLARMVAIFREVRRVLRPDGTCWVNMGDTYANDTKWGGSTGGKAAKGLHGATSVGRGKKSTGLPPKSLTGMPWRLAFALQDDGWTLRSNIVWHKPNPMPEAVKDRPTVAHEFIFLFSKNEWYFYNSEEARERCVVGAAHPRKGKAALEAARAFSRRRKTDPKDRQYEYTAEEAAAARERQSIKLIEKSFLSDEVREIEIDAAPERLVKGKQNASFQQAVVDVVEFRNWRDVWTIPTQPSSLEHFAAYPEELARRCIIAGSKHGDLVLDPFAGTATTGIVALKEGRRFVGVELNPAYAAMAEERSKSVTPSLFLRADGAA